jgi:hypothetical protein
MKKLVALLVIGVCLVPSSAAAGEFLYAGNCVVKDGHVSLIGKISAHDYGYYGPVRWVYRARPVGTTGWSHQNGFREELNVAPDGSFTSRFRSSAADADEMIYRLDVVQSVGEDGYSRHNRIAYYNDSTWDGAGCS